MVSGWSIDRLLGSGIQGYNGIYMVEGGECVRQPYFGVPGGGWRVWDISLTVRSICPVFGSGVNKAFSCPVFGSEMSCGRGGDFGGLSYQCM